MNASGKAVLSLTLGFTLSLAVVARADVFKDAAFWFDGAKVGTSGRTFAKGDMLDVTKVAQPLDARNQAEMCGAAPLVTNVNVVCPFAGRTVGQQVLHFNQELIESTKEFDESGKLTSAKATHFQSVILNDGTGIVTRGNPFSAFIRFRPGKSLLADWATLKGLTGTNYRSCLLSIGPGISGKHNLSVYLCYDAVNGNFKIAAYCGTDYAFNGVVTDLGLVDIGDWCELAVATIPPDGKGGKGALRFALSKSSGAITFATLNAGNATWDPRTDESRRVQIGAGTEKSWQKDEVVRSDATWFRCFNGDVASIGLWNRTLSDLEMREAISTTIGGTVMEVGVKNDSSSEFTGLEGGVAVNAASPSEWRNFPAELSAAGASSVNVKFKTTERADFLAGTAQLLRLEKVSGGGELTAAIGSHVEKVVWTDGIGFAYFPGDCFVTGEQTLTLTCTSGSVALDCLTLGGSWQVGYADGKNTEFGDLYSGPLHTYHVAVNDCKLCSSGYCGTAAAGAFNLIFTLDKFVAEHCPTYISSKCIQTSISAYPHQFYANVLVNGNLFMENVPISPYLAGGDSKTAGILGVRFPKGTFVAGENTITIQNVTDGVSWTKNDYFKFEVEKPRGIYGLVLMVR